MDMCKDGIKSKILRMYKLLKETDEVLWQRLELLKINP